MQQKLRFGEDVETKKCTILALAAGVEWVSDGLPKRSPARRRIDVLPSGIRPDELLSAEQAHEHTVGVENNTAREILSICHDILTADHERDYQALGMFLLPSIWKYLACEMVTVESDPPTSVRFHSYPACPTANIPHRVPGPHDVGKSRGRFVHFNLGRLANKFVGVYERCGSPRYPVEATCLGRIGNGARYAVEYHQAW